MKIIGFRKSSFKGNDGTVVSGVHPGPFLLLIQYHETLMDATRR